MSRRTVSWLIGGGIALLAAFIALTVVPVTTQAGLSTHSEIHASTGPDAPTCADLDFTIKFDYSVARPLLNPWGFAQVRDLSADTAVITALACDERSTLAAAHVGILHPACDGQPGLVMWGDISTIQDACDLKGVVLTAGLDSTDGAQLSWGFSGPWPLPGSSVVRGEWCLDPLAAVTFDYDGGQDLVAADVTDGDLCLDLS